MIVHAAEVLDVDGGVAATTFATGAVAVRETSSVELATLQLDQNMVEPTNSNSTAHMKQHPMGGHGAGNNNTKVCAIYRTTNQHILYRLATVLLLSTAITMMKTAPSTPPTSLPSKWIIRWVSNNCLY